MKKDVDSLALAEALTPSQVWDAVSAKFYCGEDREVVRGMTRAQVLKRVHDTRYAHFGGDVHGRIEVAPLSKVKNSQLDFFQFHHIWRGRASNEKKRDGVDRVIGWSHPNLMKLLRYENLTLFIDGTFRCVPSQYKQCVVLMVYDMGSKCYVPVFFVLCTSKTYDTYWNLLQYISDACGEKPRPKQVVCDFELALINAVRDWFPGAKIIGCHFHFKQACQRKMKKYRIPQCEASIAMERGVLDMLTVIDKMKIESHGLPWVISKIKDRCNDKKVQYSVKKWKLFWQYFKRVWLQLFPPDFWNIKDVHKSMISRTNNPLERFNRELNAAFPASHPSLPRFVTTIEGISSRYVRLLSDIGAGIAAAPKRNPYEIPEPVELSDTALAGDSDDSAASDEDCCSSNGQDHSELDAFVDTAFDYTAL